MNANQRPPASPPTGAPFRPMAPPPAPGMHPVTQFARPPSGSPARPPMQGAPIPSARPPLAPGAARPMQPQQRPVMGSLPGMPPQQRPGMPLPQPGAMQSPPIQNSANLVSSMQNMHLRPSSPVRPPPTGPQAPPSGRSKRVYAVSPEIAGTTASARPPSSAPWPHGLPQQLPPHPPAPAPGMPAISSPAATGTHPAGPAPVPPQPQPAIHQPLAPPTVMGAKPSPRAGVGYTQGPYTHTQQQLPPELRPPQQPRHRIDPDQMPAPVQVREQDQILFDDKFFGTLERDRVPLATTRYIGLDQGNCNPRFMRSTVDKMPFSREIAYVSKLPIGLIIQPLAKQRPDEVPVQVVDHGEEGPVRCTRCRAYINPWCTFVQGGARFICSICSHSNEVPSWYFANVDMSGRRIDVEQRPELRYGSVEFEVPKDYNSARTPSPLNYVFAIDVSAHAVRTGMLEACCGALLETLYGAHSEQQKLNPGSKIGILTFDKAVHYYNLSASLSQVQMMVVPDIDDLFVPLEDGFLVDPMASKDIIEELLQNLPTMFKETQKPEAVFSSAVRGGMLALQKTGGQVFVFQSCLPTYGPDALKSRDDKALYGTDKEKTLLSVQSEKYTDLGKECVKNGVCVNSWFFPTHYVDVATLGAISELTGGDVRYYPNFTARDKPKLIYQLDHDVHREIGYDGVLRVRCSDGLQVIDHYGNCHMSTYTDMELAGIDEDKTIAAVLKHDSKLDTNRGVSFQCALLYTNKQGRRRVRVHNLNLSVTTQIADVFRFGDEDAAISILLRQAIFDLPHKNRKDVHQKLTDLCVNILMAYRNNCASSTSSGQLILPEAFKLLPVYVHGALRSSALRGVGVDVNTDFRSAGMRLFNSLSVAELVWTLYPRMFAVHTMDNQCGTSNMKGEVLLPPMVRVSYDRLDPKGAYLVDTGSDMFLWLGSNIAPELLEEIFAVKSLDQVDPEMTLLPALTTERSHQLHGIIRYLQSQRSRYLQLRIIRQNMDPMEFIFSTWMTEDRNAEVQTYVDFMCVLHRKIQEEMKKANN